MRVLELTELTVWCIELKFAIDPLRHSELVRWIIDSPINLFKFV